MGGMSAAGFMEWALFSHRTTYAGLKCRHRAGLVLLVVAYAKVIMEVFFVTRIYGVTSAVRRTLCEMPILKPLQIGADYVQNTAEYS